MEDDARRARCRGRRARRGARGEVQARRRRGDAARLAGEDGLVALAVSGRVGPADVGRQRHVPVAFDREARARPSSARGGRVVSRVQRQPRTAAARASPGSSSPTREKPRASRPRSPPASVGGRAGRRACQRSPSRRRTSSTSAAPPPGRCPAVGPGRHGCGWARGDRLAAAASGRSRKWWCAVAPAGGRARGGARRRARRGAPARPARRELVVVAAMSWSLAGRSALKA